MSNLALERIIPVKPPTVNKETNPNPHNKEIALGTNLTLEPKIEANQLNTFIPVGIPINIVTAVK